MASLKMCKEFSVIFWGKAFKYIKKKNVGIEEMAQWLRVFDVLASSRGSDFSSQIVPSLHRAPICASQRIMETASQGER